MMHVITRNTRASSAPARWQRQYPKGRWPDKDNISEQLVALGDNPCPDKVNEAIGNNSWTSTCCDECRARDVPVVQLGEPQEYESCTAHICKQCLMKALNMEGLE